MTRESSSQSARLKVLFVTPWYPSTRNAVQGTFIREHAKAAGLRDDVAVVHLAGAEANASGRRFNVELTPDESLAMKLPLLRITYRRPPVPKTAYLLYVWSALVGYRRLAQAGFRPDLIHAQTYAAGPPALFVGAFYRLPVLISEHSTAFPDGRLSALELWKARISFRQARAVLPVSLYLQKAMESLGLQAAYRLVPNAIDTTIFHPGTGLVPGAPKRILFVGLLSPVKGLPLLLDALTRLPQRLDWQLDVIGDGPNRFEYEDAVRRLELGSRVRFHGIKRKEQVAQFMRTSALLVIASRMETQSCVILEAMATGLSIVAPSVGAIPEVLDPRSGVLVKPNDPVDLAKAITRSLEDDLRLRPMDAVESVRSRYSLDAVGTILAGLYREFATPKDRAQVADLQAGR